MYSIRQNGCELFIGGKVYAFLKPIPTQRTIYDFNGTNSLVELSGLKHDDYNYIVAIAASPDKKRANVHLEIGGLELRVIDEPWAKNAVRERIKSFSFEFPVQKLFEMLTAV